MFYLFVTFWEISIGISFVSPKSSGSNAKNVPHSKQLSLCLNGWKHVAQYMAQVRKWPCIGFCMSVSVPGPYHTHLCPYTSTRPTTASCCRAWCPHKPSCVGATWSSCRPSSLQPARSRRPARRPSLTCAGTVPRLKSPVTPRGIVQILTEVGLLVTIYYLWWLELGVKYRNQLQNTGVNYVTI